MMRIFLSVGALLLFFVSVDVAQTASGIPNPEIDMKGFLETAKEAALHREKRRLTEDQFIKMSETPGVIVLDARSKEMFDLLHIDGAVNLSFPDIAVDSLAKLLPDKNATILIYCNNNFKNTVVKETAVTDPFPRKIATASLNLSTYVSLYSYGYRNIYELGPLLDLKTTKIKMASSNNEKKSTDELSF